MSLEQDAINVSKLVGYLSRFLAGQDPSLIGAVLADLTAMWIVSHVNLDDADDTDRMRSELIDLHVAAINQLISVNDLRASAKPPSEGLAKSGKSR